MKLSRTVAYALQATLQLAQAKSGSPVPCSQLAATGHMPERFLLQVLRSLVTHGILQSTRGVEGGYTLERKPEDITLFIAGHGTDRSDHSRNAVEQQVELIRSQGIYADVRAVFMDQDPRIAGCQSTVSTRHVVVVPFFISDGLHVVEDIPVLLGEPESLVKERHAAGRPTWRNPTEKHGKLTWYSPAVGSEPLMADVILERVREAARAE